MLSIYNEFIKGRTISEWLFLTLGLCLQLVAYLVDSNTSCLSFISGCAGVISVVLCSQKKISFYLFGFIQLFTYIVICWQQHLYGEIGENIFYALTMIIGLVIWYKNYNDNVVTKELTINGWALSFISFIIASVILGYILSLSNDTQPYLDAISTVPAVIAQLLMILRYKEQWIFWLIVDILTGVLWVNAENWCMVAQYVFWTANCIYGFKKWSTN